MKHDLSSLPSGLAILKTRQHPSQPIISSFPSIHLHGSAPPLSSSNDSVSSLVFYQRHRATVGDIAVVRPQKDHSSSDKFWLFKIVAEIGSHKLRIKWFEKEDDSNLVWKLTEQVWEQKRNCIIISGIQMMDDSKLSFQMLNLIHTAVEIDNQNK